jgi:hypothetical protein
MPRRDRQEEALTRILELAQTALARRAPGSGDRSDGREEGRHDGRYEDGAASTEAVIACTPRALPPRLQQGAAELARRVNPVNAPLLGAAAGLFDDTPLDPMRIAVLTAKYWGPRPRRLTVSFMEQTSAALRDRILGHLNAWSARSCISFAYTAGVGQVRISRGPGGYWSYLGTDVLLIPANRPTMNLEGFTLNTSEREYRRVVRHEAGHTLGCPHEHMRKALVDRIDRNKAYAYFWQTQGWNRAMVDQQVLTPLSEASIMGTPADQTSIMCYQLPGSITKDGQPILGGADINATDHAFIGRIYPRPGASMHQYTADHDAASSDELASAGEAHAYDGHEHDGHAHEGPSAVDDWDPSDDVRVEDVEVAV